MINRLFILRLMLGLPEHAIDFVKDLADVGDGYHKERLRLLKACCGYQAELDEFYAAVGTEKIVDELADVLFWLIEIKSAAEALRNESIDLTPIPREELCGGSLLDAAEKYCRTAKVRSESKREQDFYNLKFELSSCLTSLALDLKAANSLTVRTIPDLFDYLENKLTKRHLT